VIDLDPRAARDLSGDLGHLLAELTSALADLAAEVPTLPTSAARALPANGPVVPVAPLSGVGATWRDLARLASPTACSPRCWPS
jgi:hypothetical protein